MLKYIGALVVFVSCTLSGLTLCEMTELPETDASFWFTFAVTSLS